MNDSFMEPTALQLNSHTQFVEGVFSRPKDR